jgi:drug/metabolite transporter (DMT)-like permease
MTLPILLAVACSLAWSGHDALRKVLVAEIRPLALLVLLAGGSAPPFALWLALDPSQQARPMAGYLLPAAISVALNVGANLALLRGMRLAPLSLAVPLLSLTPAFATLTAIPLLGERPSLLDSLGIVLVVSGAIWMGRGKAGASTNDPQPELSGADLAAAHAGAGPVEAVPQGSSEQALASPAAITTDPARSEAQARASHPEVFTARAGTLGDRLHRPFPAPDRRAVSLSSSFSSDQERRRHREGALWMGATALAWSFTPALDKLAMERSSAAFHALVLTAGVAVAVFILLAASHRTRELAGVARVPGVFALAVISSTLALGFQLLAFKLLWVGLVETLKRGIGNVMALILGRVLFGERAGWAALLAVLAMAGGVALILGS